MVILTKKGAISSIKNMLGMGKDLIEDGFSASNITKVGFKSVVLPAITAFTVNSTDATLVAGSDGQMQFDFTEKVTVNDVSDLFEKFGKSTKGVSGVWNNVADMFSVGSDIVVSVPDTYIPKIEMPVIRTA